jgi:hypothetical protein
MMALTADVLYARLSHILIPRDVHLLILARHCFVHTRLGKRTAWLSLNVSAVMEIVGVPLKANGCAREEIVLGSGLGSTRTYRLMGMSGGRPSDQDMPHFCRHGKHFYARMVGLRYSSTSARIGNRYQEEMLGESVRRELEGTRRRRRRRT